MSPSLELAQKLFMDSNKGYWAFFQQYLKLQIYYIRSTSLLSERESMEKQMTVSLTLLEKLLMNIHYRNIYLKLEKQIDLMKEHEQEKQQIKKLLQILKSYLTKFDFISSKNKKICMNKIELLLKYFDSHTDQHKMIIVDNSQAPKPWLKNFCIIHKKKN